MSHDDRIKQLTVLFLEDLRAPIEASFRQLLGELMAIAAEDRTTAVNEALARAGEERQAAIDAALGGATEERERALEALRAALTTEHEVALDALRADLATHEETLASERRDLARQQEEALDALGTELALRHGDALDALRAQMAAERDELVRDRDELARDRDEAVEAARLNASAVGDTAAQAIRDELTRQHEAALAVLREQLQWEHEETVAALREQLHREQDEALVREREAWAGEQAAAAGDARAAAEATTAAAFTVIQDERDAARATIAELTDQLAAVRAEHEPPAQPAYSQPASTLSEGAVDAHVAERQSELACTERVVAAIRALDEARTLTQILAALVDHAAFETIRAAVLLVNGGRLRGWRFAGMGNADPVAVDVPVNQAGLIGRAVETRLPVSTTASVGSFDHALPAFLTPPQDRVGLALPIIVGGRVVAVLYADDAGTETPMVPSNWPEVAEVLVRHAGRCLEVLTLSRAAAVPDAAPARPAAPVEGDADLSLSLQPETEAPGGSPHVLSVKEAEAQEEESARRHARLLISEIKLYNEELVERGRREGNLVALLGSEIERARRLYEEKIPAAVQQRVDCFDEEIVRTLAGGDRTLLGQVT